MSDCIRLVSIGIVLLLTQLTFAAPPTSDEDMERQAIADSKVISVAEINEFHRQVVTKCMSELPREVTLQYLGEVATDNGRLAQRLEEANGRRDQFPLSWHVERDAVVCEFWISTKKVSSTVSQCQVGSRLIYVNVAFVDQNQDVKAPLAALGGESVHGMLQKLSKGK
jgi:hypothetical protein